MVRWSSTKALVFLLLPIASLLVGNALVSEWNTRRIVGNERLVTHSLQVLQALQEIETTISEAEAGQRGYLITGDSGYLETFDAAAGGADGQVRQLGALVGDNPRQEARAQELEDLVRSRMERLRHNVTIRQSQGSDAAFRIVQTDVGERIMRQVRAEIRLMELTEDSLLVQRAADTQHSLRIKFFTNLLGALIGLGATGLAFALFQRMLHERTRQAAGAKVRAAHETALGELRQYALSDADLHSFMNRAVVVIASTLDVPLVKVLELLPDEKDFLLRWGTGWKEGCVGTAVVSGGLDSQAGYTLHASHPVVVGDLTTFEPIVVEDLLHERRFSGPGLLREHGAVSGVSVIIPDHPNRPFGVLGAHTTRRRVFTGEELHFMQTTSSVLAVAVQRRRAEEALRNSETRFRALAESVPGVVWTSLPDGQCDYVNQRLREATGMPADESLGMGWTAALHEEDMQRSIDRWMHSMETGEPFECEYRFRMKDGTYRWWLGRALPMRADGGCIVKWFGHCTDIEDHKRMEAVLVEADQRKDQFLAMLGHELRNPLAPIVNVLELLKLRTARDQGLQRDVDVIDRQVRHMTRLLDDLLDASRIGRGEIRLERAVIDLGAVLASAVEVAHPFIHERHHAFEMEVPEETVHLEADGTRLIQSVGNVLINAAKYTPPGGLIRLVAERQGDEVEIRVRDNGVGIPTEMLPEVFDMFVQVQGNGAEVVHDGLGIGLALVKELVRMHGGSVRAWSAGPGLGSEFSIRLPVLAREQIPPEGREDVAPELASPLPHYRILVVDDNALLADTFVELLQLDGCDARVAGDGETALRMAREFQPEVVFLDLGLPDMDGYEVARRLRREPTLDNALLVAMTGYGRQRSGRRAEEAGFRHYLVKPVRIDAVERLLREHQGSPA